MVTETKKHYLYQSTIFAEKEQHIVDTILGSCISVCLYDPKLKIGGINHYMLPLWNGVGLATPKYGNIAIEKLIEKMQELGSLKSNLIAKVFGGACQIHNSSINIGERNTQIARELLAAHRIRIIAESVGGSIGRKMRFDTGTGVVLMKFLSKK